MTAMSTRRAKPKKATKGKIPVAIIPANDAPGTYRVRFADGTLSDVCNLARAQDALRAAQEGQARADRSERQTR